MSAQRESRTGEAPSSAPDFVALDRSPGFWVIMGDAVVFGVVLAFAGLAFLRSLKGGTKLWFTLPKNPGWLDGSLWWVSVTAGTGVLRRRPARVLRVPRKLAGTFEEFKGPAGRSLRRPTRWQSTIGQSRWRAHSASPGALIAWIAPGRALRSVSVGC
jgi:hypothetical protein